MKFIFFFISCLQLFAVNQSLLPETEVSIRQEGEYPGYITTLITEDNGEKITCGGALLSPCIVVALAKCFAIENYTVVVLSGQKTCVDYEQKRSVRKVIINDDVALLITEEPFVLNQNTQTVGINTAGDQPAVVKAVGCPSSTGPISTANFYDQSDEVCMNAFDDMDNKSECRKCPYPASTCTAPLGNPTFCNNNTIQGLSSEVQHPGCEIGGYVKFIKLEPYMPFIISTMAKEHCETCQPQT